MHEGEVKRDGLRVYYTIDQGEVLIDYMYEYGVEVTTFDQWGKLVERAEKIAMEDYIQHVEQERAELEITRWESEQYED